MKFEINKNTILLYALLNRFDQALGEKNTTNLRTEMVEVFKDYTGTKPNPNEYIHPSKCFFWGMSVSNTPVFESKKREFNAKQQHEFNYGSKIKPYLVEFYENTEFEKYFEMVKPKLEKINTEFEEEFGNKNIKQILEDTWGIKSDAKIVIIINPFTTSSFGPKIGDINYQMLGMWGDRPISSYMHNIIHEGSHPFAKEILKPYAKDIEQISEILEKAYENDRYPKSYKYWGTCFEEHLVRVVHRGLINQKIKYEHDLEKSLYIEKDKNGMIFIDDFYGIIKKETSVNSSIPKIIESLKQKYS